MDAYPITYTATKNMRIAVIVTMSSFRALTFNLLYHEPQQDDAADDDAEDGREGDILLP